MEIKRRKKKKAEKAPSTPRPRGRSAQIQGYRGPGVYLYDYITNRLTPVKEPVVRFYHVEDTYVELTPKEDYIAVRGAGDGLRRLIMRATGSNWFEIKAMLNKLDDIIWSEKES